MCTRYLAAMAAIALGLAACGPNDKDEPTPDKVASTEVSFTGVYQVQGKTVEVDSGATRALSGLIIVVQEGTDYTASFDLQTAFPSPDGPTEAQIIGTGSGKVEGTTLNGTARTQTILALVAGVDASFALLPRSYGPCLLSTTKASLNDDGSITVHMDSSAEGAKECAATHSTLQGAPR